MVYKVSQFRFGKSDITKKRLSAVPSAHEFRQELSELNVGYEAIVM